MERIYIAAGGSVAFLVAAFFLGGFYEDLRWRIERRRRGGMLL